MLKRSLRPCYVKLEKLESLDLSSFKVELIENLRGNIKILLLEKISLNNNNNNIDL